MTSTQTYMYFMPFAMPLALSLAGENDMVCVTGSLFVASGAIEQAVFLGLKPGTGEK